MSLEIKDRNKSFEVDKLYYEESTLRGIHLSYAFYVTLGLFIAIIGGFLSFKGELGGYANFIGLIFLLLLLPLAKISRLQADNGDVHDKFQQKHKSNVIFNGTGIKGVGDFFHYCILISITSFFLLKPLRYIVPPIIFVGLFLLSFGFLVFVIYYVLARGDFIFGEIGLSKNKESQNLFLGVLMAFSIIYGLYWLIIISN